MFRFILTLMIFLTVAPANADPLRISKNRGLVVLTMDWEGFERDRVAALETLAADDMSLRASFIRSGSKGGFMLDIGRLEPGTNRLSKNIMHRYSLYPVYEESGNTIIRTAQVPEGDYVIYAYSHDGVFRHCLNTQSVSFSVKVGTFNYIGSYNPFENTAEIFQSVDDGRLPKSYFRGTVFKLRDFSLKGFSANTDRPDLKTVAEAYIKLKSPKRAKDDFTLGNPEIKTIALDIDEDKPYREDYCPL